MGHDRPASTGGLHSIECPTAAGDRQRALAALRPLARFDPLALILVHRRHRSLLAPTVTSSRARAYPDRTVASDAVPRRTWTSVCYYLNGRSGSRRGYSNNHRWPARFCLELASGSCDQSCSRVRGNDGSCLDFSGFGRMIVDIGRGESMGARSGQRPRSARRSKPPVVPARFGGGLGNRHQRDQRRSDRRLPLRPHHPSRGHVGRHGSPARRDSAPVCPQAIAGLAGRGSRRIQSIHARSQAWHGAAPPQSDQGHRVRQRSVHSLIL